MWVCEGIERGDGERREEREWGRGEGMEGIVTETGWQRTWC